MKKILFVGFIFLFGFLLVGCQNEGTTTTAGTREFTLEDLAAYTGENGTTAYIAVDGIVYDVTEAFEDGMHQDLQLGGTDATTVFAISPHSDEILDTLPIVGVLVDDTNQTTTEITTQMPTTTQAPSTSQAPTSTQMPTTTQTPTTTPVPTTTEAPTTNLETTLYIFTLEELAMYTGEDGTTAYIAVYGIVYDVTDVFTNGVHQGNQLGGTDATAIFETSPHSLSQLDNLTIVGYLEGYEPV